MGREVGGGFRMGGTHVSVQFSRSVVSDSATPWIAAVQASLSITNSQSLLKSVMPSSYLILCRPLLLLPPIPPSIKGLFQWINSLHEVVNVLEFQLQHQSFQWTPRTYFHQDGLVGSPCSPRDSQGSSPTPQFESINFSALSFLHSQLSHPYMTTGKTIALTRWTFVGKVMSLLLICCLGWS